MNRSIAIPFLVACLGIALFSLMDAVVKGLALALGAYNAMLWRQMAATGLGGFTFLATRSALPDRAGMRLAALRGILGAGMAFTFFWGIARVPLAEGIALSFIAPLIALYLAAVLLGETIGRAAVWASVIGLSGVIVIVGARLGEGAYDRETLMGLGSIIISAVAYAWNIILQRQQALISSPVQITFLQNLFALCATALFAPWLAVLPTGAIWPTILLSALLSYVSLYLLSWAYARAEAQVLIPVEYTAFIWAVIFGALFFEEAVTLATLAGAVLIVAGCLVAARRRPADHVETIAL